MPRFFYATRKSDGAPTVLWIRGEGAAQKVTCLRASGRPVRIEEYYVLGRVPRRHDCRTPFNIADRERRERRRLLASGADPAAVAAAFGE